MKRKGGYNKKKSIIKNQAKKKNTKTQQWQQKPETKPINVCFYRASLGRQWEKWINRGGGGLHKSVRSLKYIVRMSFRKIYSKCVWKYSHVLYGFGAHHWFYKAHVYVWLAISTVCAAYQRNHDHHSASGISHQNGWRACCHSNVRECLAHRITYFWCYVMKCSTWSHYWLRALLRISAAYTCVSLVTVIVMRAVPTIPSAIHRAEKNLLPPSPRFSMFFLPFFQLIVIYVCCCFGCFVFKFPLFFKYTRSRKN